MYFYLSFADSKKRNEGTYTENKDAADNRGVLGVRDLVVGVAEETLLRAAGDDTLVGGHGCDGEAEV